MSKTKQLSCAVESRECLINILQFSFIAFMSCHGTWDLSRDQLMKENYFPPSIHPSISSVSSSAHSMCHVSDVDWAIPTWKFQFNVCSRTFSSSKKDLFNIWKIFHPVLSYFYFEYRLYNVSLFEKKWFTLNWELRNEIKFSNYRLRLWY